MKRFIKTILLFSAPVIICLVFVEFCLRTIPNDYSYKSEYLDNFSNNINVLYLGNSHFFYGINPEFASTGGFNAAYVSQSLRYDNAILEKYKDQWQNLTHIVIPIGYPSLYTTLESTEKWRKKYYNIYYNINVGGVWDHFEILNGKFSYNLERLKDRIIRQKTGVTSNALGFGTSYTLKKSKNLIETGISAAKRHTIDVSQVNYLSENLVAIHSIINHARELKIKIIFLTPPAYSTYVNNLEPKQLNNTLKYITDITLQHSHTKYYNLLKDSSFVAMDFFDADHLNDIGARKFTLKIDSLLKLH